MAIPPAEWLAHLSVLHQLNGWLDPSGGWLPAPKLPTSPKMPINKGRATRPQTTGPAPASQPGLPGEPLWDRSGVGLPRWRGPGLGSAYGPGDAVATHPLRWPSALAWAPAGPPFQEHFWVPADVDSGKFFLSMTVLEFWRFGHSATTPTPELGVSPAERSRSPRGGGGATPSPQGECISLQ